MKKVILKFSLVVLLFVLVSSCSLFYPPVYTVSFDTKGGTEIPNQFVSEGTTANIPSIPTKNEYTWAGWYSDSGYASSWDFATEIISNITLYAKWIITDYTIAYHLDGGSNHESNLYGYNTDSETIILQDPTRIGFYFAGWYSDYSLIRNVTEIPKGSSSNIDLYAKWLAYTPESSFSYITINTNEIEITRFTGSETTVVIPDRINGNRVTSIGDYLFDYSKNNLISVIIPNSVNAINSFAFFNCESLASIIVDADNPYYSSIGGVLFDKAKKKLISYPAGIPNTFYHIPTSVITIGEFSFFSSDNLVTITIPDSVTTIEWGAFEYCESLASITIPHSVARIDGGFFNCRSLTNIFVDAGNTSYDSIEGVLFNEAVTELITYPAGKTNSTYIIPDGVSLIGRYSFSSSDNLVTITIPDSVTAIEYGAFRYCDSLTSITIPDSVTIIEWGAFENCNSLTAIIVDTGNISYESIGGVLFNKGETELIAYPAGNANSNYIIPDSVTFIGNSAFESCTNLTNITIPTSVSTIGDQTFWGCTNLTSIVIPPSVSSIGWGAFTNCDSLVSVVIPINVTTVESSAFQSCNRLTNIYCEATSKPTDWNDYWANGTSATITWGYTSL